MKVKLSIIVPMYNVEKYLDQCIQSLQHQTLQDIEIILVDDGSPDACGLIADSYSRKDDRIRVIHRENGGLGPARNSGLEIASGEFIGFVDSDDWVEPQMYEELINAIEKTQSDVCFSGMQVINDGVQGDKNVNPFAGCILEGQEEIFKLRRSFYGGLPNRQKWDPVPISVWTAVYNRRFLAEHNIKFRDIRSEDKFFNTAVCRLAKRVTAIGETRYNYRCDGQSSITRSFSDEMIPSYLKMFEALNEMANEEDAQYRDECLLRARRCIVDYSRVAIQVISRAGCSREIKIKSIKQLINSQVIRTALTRFPCHSLPIMQGLFAQSMRLGLSRMLLFQAQLKQWYM